jgi:hypothetical protein
LTPKHHTLNHKRQTLNMLGRRYRPVTFAVEKSVKAILQGESVQGLSQPVALLQGYLAHKKQPPSNCPHVARGESCEKHRLQGYLAHKKTHPPRTLQYFNA